jgi:hypothetical protein
MELAIVVISYCLLPKPHASYTGVNIVVLPKILSPVPSFLVKRVLIKTEHGLEIISVATTTTTMPFFLPRLTGAFPSISHTHTYLVPAEPQPPPPPPPPLFPVYQNMLDKLETNHLRKCTKFVA